MVLRHDDDRPYEYEDALTAIVNPSDAADFLTALWPEGIRDDERITVSYGPAPKSARHFAHPDAAADFVASNGHTNIWINLATRPAGLGRHERGTKGQALRLPALWADLDIDDPAHKPGARVFPDTDAAWSAVRAIESVIGPAQLVVHSGHGLAPYWLLDEPAEPELADALLAELRRVTGDLTGDVADAVFNRDRCMRAPGSVNHKTDTPAPARIAHHDPYSERYSADELLAALRAHKSPEPAHGPHSATPDGVSRTGRTANPDARTGRPGDDYNASADTDSVVAMLARHGATKVDSIDHDGRQVIRMARPGKTDDGHSLSVGWVAPGWVTLWSSGWPALPHDPKPGAAETHYSPWQVYAHLDHGGDFNAAAAALRSEGYGDQADEPEPLASVPDDLTDTDVARHFAAWLDDQAIYVPGIGWMTWQAAEGRYTPDEERHAVGRLAEAYTAALYRRYRDARDAADPDDKDALKAAEAARKEARGWRNAGRQNTMIDMAARHTGVSPDALDAHPHLLNVANGIVDLRTGELAPHDPRHRCTKLADVHYDPDATSPDWTKAISGLDQSLHDYLQVGAGMSAYGKAPTDAVFVALGGGGNGKSTTLGAIYSALGDYAVSVPAHVITEGGGNRPQELIPLRGARFALIAEMGEDHYLAAERVKALTGGDPITDRYLYARTTLTWKPTHAFWIMTNHRPGVRDTTDGIWRRLRLIEYRASYVADADDGLRDRVAELPENRSAVLAWIVRGAVEWHRTGRLPACAAVDGGVMTWRNDESEIRSFMVEAGYVFTSNEGDRIGRSELYKTYSTWSAETGGRGYKQKRFAEELHKRAKVDGAKLGEGRARGANGSGVRCWTGIQSGHYFQDDEYGDPAYSNNGGFNEGEEAAPW